MIPLAFRNDGFSLYFREPPLSAETLLRENVDVLAGSNVEWLGWGVGPSSVFCYDTEVGERFCQGVSGDQWDLFRKGDRWVHENLGSLIDSGNDPLNLAVRRAHEQGMKVYARYQMNHEYGPADPANFLWVGFVGRLNKEHPEYRIPGSTHLDFVHGGVREFKLRIIREVAERGVDAIMLDFTVYPPHVADPNPAVITGFMREARRVVAEVGRSQEREIKVIAELPFRGGLELGLDWRAWMDEGSIDVVVPTRVHAGEVFDVRIDEFVERGRRTGCGVWGFIWFSLGLVATDPMPDDDKTGAKRHTKPKTREMFHSQALHFHRAGVDAIEIAESTTDRWSERPWYDLLADGVFLEHAPKHYMVDPLPHVPVRLVGGRASVPLRVADDVPGARRSGRSVRATVVVYCRGLGPGESLGVGMNGHEAVTIVGGMSEENAEDPIDWRAESPVWTQGAAGTFLSDPEWWRRGEHTVAVNPEWIQRGENWIELYHQGEEMTTSWIDLRIEYPEEESEDGC